VSFCVNFTENTFVVVFNIMITPFFFLILFFLLHNKKLVLKLARKLDQIRCSCLY
jgi:hypothetical protein